MTCLQSWTTQPWPGAQTSRSLPMRSRLATPWSPPMLRISCPWTPATARPARLMLGSSSSRPRPSPKTAPSPRPSPARYLPSSTSQARSSLGRYSSCPASNCSSPLKLDAGQEFAEGGAIGGVVGGASRRVLGCEHVGGPVMDCGHDLHHEAAPRRALHVQQPGGFSADRDRLGGLRGRGAWM